MLRRLTLDCVQHIIAAKEVGARCSQGDGRSRSPAGPGNPWLADQVQFRLCMCAGSHMGALACVCDTNDIMGPAALHHTRGALIGSAVFLNSSARPHQKCCVKNRADVR